MTGRSLASGDEAEGRQGTVKEGRVGLHNPSVWAGETQAQSLALLELALVLRAVLRVRAELPPKYS